MDEKKVQEIFSDEAFVGSLMAMESAEEVQAAVKAKGLDLTVGDIERIKAQLVSGKSDELSSDDLDNVAGGFAITLALVGCIASCIGATASVGSFVHLVTRRRW